MSYQALARKYRPQKLSELIGQDGMVKTLRNGILHKKVPHAVILTGIRGVGKTTTARIIAKSVNCLAIDSSKESSDACCVCTNCISIASSNHPDVFEFDAASRTGVNDIRDVIESTKYVPSSAKYKIYIIDEVHMLSTSAFNALLKTLEEPPQNVLFIFATTELRKVPITILSRCQKFFLSPLPIEKLTSHVKEVASQESITIEDQAAEIIAARADGSVRDALSLLDNAILSTEKLNCITVQDVSHLTNNSIDFSANLLLSIVKGDGKQALEKLQGAQKTGSMWQDTIEDLLEIINNSIKAKILPATKQAQPDATKGTYLACVEEISKLCDINHLLNLWQIISHTFSQEKLIKSDISLEMLIIKLAYAAKLPGTQEVIKRLESEFLNSVCNKLNLNVIQ